MFSYFYSKPVIPPPLNTINDPLLNYTKVNDVNILESRFRDKSKSPHYYSTDNYSNEQFSRAKRHNKHSTANLNMGVELARKGILPNLPENQYIFEELSRRNNTRQEQIRKQEFENLQKEHASNMPERIRQNKRTRRQYEEEERQQQEEYKEYQRRQQEEYEEYQRQEQETRQHQFEEQERLRKEQEKRQRQFEEKEQERIRKEQERLKKEQERLRKEQEKRQRQFEEKEQERIRKEQERLEAEQVINIPTGITDINQCPAFKVELPTNKLDCNRSMYKKMSLNLHPDKNNGCTDYASSKFQELANICDGNQFVVGGRNKRKTKKNKKKTKKHQKRKQKNSKKKKI